MQRSLLLTRFGRVVSLLALLLAVGAAQTAHPERSKKSYTVVFHTYPPDLAVFRYHPEVTDPSRDDYLGQSDREVYLDIGEWEVRDEWQIYFVYVPQGQPQGSQIVRPQVSEMLTIRPGTLVSQGRYPQPGEVYRPSLSWGQWRNYYFYAIGVHYWWAWLSLLGFCAAILRFSLAQWRRGNQAIVREEKRTELTAEMLQGDPLEGQLIGDYLVVMRIGEGGMGVVYRAVRKDNPDPENPVAIKLIRGVQEDQRRRFFNECRVYQRFRHINILTVLETGIADVSGIYKGWPYMVSEFVQGQSIRELIGTYSQGVPLKLAAPYLVQLMRALTHAHQTGVIHRDVKPENVLIANSKLSDGNQRVVLMDFGVARSTDQPRLTAVGDILGTPLYMAPEQVRGEPCEASDQYSLGLIAYEMLCGSSPFGGENPTQVIMQQLHEEPRSLAELKPNLPDRVVQSVHRMLQKEVPLRYHHMADVTAEWEALASGVRQPKGG